MHMPAVQSSRVENAEGVKTDKIDKVNFSAKMVPVETSSLVQSAAQQTSVDDADAPQAEATTTGPADD
jgi:hypothetical protein